MIRRGKWLALLMLPIILLTQGNKVYAAKSDEQIEPSVEISEGTRISSRLWNLVFGKDKTVDGGQTQLIVGGDVFGARISQGFISVCEDSEKYGVKRGDRLLSVDGRGVFGMLDLKCLIESEGEHTLYFERKAGRYEVKITEREDARLLCSILTDGAAGIGTITYINPADMSFGGLGHGICDDTGTPIPTKSGKVSGVILGGIKRGASGAPGELSGVLTDRVRGEITANTPIGVFGKLDEVNPKGDLLPIAKKSEVKEGPAKIICTLKSGKRGEYAVEIHDLSLGESGTKCFKLKVTDKTLLALSGGIVRGMSGSPIIQDGKLVGAVTHVMVADPTEGYGIFIENMLNAASNAAALPKAA